MSSYRLESPRPRSQLTPIRVRSNYTTPSTPGSPPTLLYDLPQPSSTRSPPPPAVIRSPPLKSPTLPPDSPRHRSRQTPPPRARSATPAQSYRLELDRFATYCRAWYFDQDENAGKQMTQILESLDPSQRAPFSRLQSSIRSAYHTAMSRRRRSEFRAHLSSTHPGGSLSPSSRANSHGKAAKKERYDRLCRFIRTWCMTGMPGPRPFFQALWAVLRLQVLPVELGGAGPRRIEWEFDDAVFQESAGKEFMLEAIDVLKGVLCFEEYLPPQSRRQSRTTTDEADTSMLTAASTTTAVKMTNLRPRSPSDPFLDTPTLSHSIASTASGTAATLNSDTNNARTTTAATRTEGDRPTELLSLSPDNDNSHLANQRTKETLDPDEDNDGPFLRVWTMADLGNPELQALISLFPDFIARHALPRFPIQAITTVGRISSGRSIKPSDIEVGLNVEEEEEEGEGEGRRDVSCGTGRMWVGRKKRSYGWQGSWWQRFSGWWRRMFGC